MSDDYVLVVIDEYILFHEVEIITSTSAKVIISNLNSIIARQGLPTVDNGPSFQSQEFTDFAIQSGFRHRKTTLLWSEANGESERFMRTMNKFHWARFPCQYKPKPYSNQGVSSISANYALSKDKMKTNVNQWHHIQTSSFLPDDNKLVKQHRQNNLSLPFDPMPYSHR